MWKYILKRGTWRVICLLFALLLWSLMLFYSPVEPAVILMGP